MLFRGRAGRVGAGAGAAAEGSGADLNGASVATTAPVGGGETSAAVGAGGGAGGEAQHHVTLSYNGKSAAAPFASSCEVSKTRLHSARFFDSVHGALHDKSRWVTGYAVSSAATFASISEAKGLSKRLPAV